MKPHSRSWSIAAIPAVMALIVLVLISISARAAGPRDAAVPVSARPPQAVMARAAGLQVPEPEAIDPTLLSLEWRYGLYGSGIGASDISVFDIDGDGTLEMIMGGSSAGGFGADDFWYVVKTTGANTYGQVRLGDWYPTTIERIAVADANANGIGEIYVGLADGQVYIYDGLSLAQTGSFTAGGPISALVVANADGDSDQEIVIAGSTNVYVYSTLSLALEWAGSGYGNEVVAGNVDGDPAPEIVASGGGGGYVIDGVSHVVEWYDNDGFGIRLELGDVDNDGMAEIVGGWGGATAYDADTHSVKWTLPTGGALLVANTDGAGAPEVLTGDTQWGAIHCYDSLTQAERWSINNPEPGVTDIGVGDVNNDGVVEVLWGAGYSSTGPDYLFVADTVVHLIEWQNLDVTGPLSAVDVGDVDDDGQTEIVMVSDRSNGGSYDSIVHIFNASTHALEWRSTDLPDIYGLIGTKSVQIGDVDRDGRAEFVIATADIDDGLIQIYDGQSHTLERQSTKYTDASFSALAIGDLEHDGNTEIVVGQHRHAGDVNAYLLVFDGATAAEEWRSDALAADWRPVYDIELANVDSDSALELIASVSGGPLYVYDGATHQQQWLADIPAYALAAANVDIHPDNEILVGRDNGAVDVYDATSQALQGSFTLGSGPIEGLLIDDIDQDSEKEWVVAESATLSVFRSGTKELAWQMGNLGSALGYHNHLNSLNIENDRNKELVLGSMHALYQFGATWAGPLGLSSKSVTPTSTNPGEPLAYTIAVRNNDVSALSNVRVTDTLPADLTYIDGSLTATGGSYGYNAGTITWTGSVNAGRAVTITFGATVNPTVRLDTTVSNSALIKGAGATYTRSALAAIPPARFHLPLVIRNLCGPYRDDFTNPASGWYVDDNGRSRWEYLGGEYRMLVRTLDSWAGARAPAACADYTAAVDVRNATGGDATYGLIFGLSDDWQQFYTFEISVDGYYLLWRYDAGDWNLLTWGQSPSINTGTGTNRLKLDRIGAQIAVYANNQLLVSGSDATYTGLRRVGLIVSSYNEHNVDARFDNFAMCQPGCSADASLSEAELAPQITITLPPTPGSNAASSGANGSKPYAPSGLLPRPDPELAEP